MFGASASRVGELIPSGFSQMPRAADTGNGILDRARLGLGEIDQLLDRVGLERRMRDEDRGPRAAGYGSLSMDESIRRGDDARIIAQIESPEAVAEADTILSIDGIDGVFVGRADLALSFRLNSAKHERVLHATYRVLEAARSRNKIAGIAAGDREECEAFKAAGANWFVIASDQSLLRRAVQQVCKS